MRIVHESGYLGHQLIILVHFSNSWIPRSITTCIVYHVPHQCAPGVTFNNIQPFDVRLENKLKQIMYFSLLITEFKLSVFHVMFIPLGYTYTLRFLPINKMRRLYHSHVCVSSVELDPECA